MVQSRRLERRQVPQYRLIPASNLTLPAENRFTPLITFMARISNLSPCNMLCSTSTRKTVEARIRKPRNGKGLPDYSDERRAGKAKQRVREQRVALMALARGLASTNQHQTQTSFMKSDLQRMQLTSKVGYLLAGGVLTGFHYEFADGVSLPYARHLFRVDLFSERRENCAS